MPSRNRIVLLTGAGGGIGTVMTRALLDAGHSVAAVDRDAGSLDRLKHLVRGAERLSPNMCGSQYRGRMLASDPERASGVRRY